MHRKPTTLFISAYRAFSMRYILCTDIIDVLKKQIDNIVIFVKDEDIKKLRTLYQSQNITVESIDFKRAREQTTRNVLVTSLIILRKFTSGRRGNFLNSTANLNKIQFKQEYSFGWAKRIFTVLCFISFFAARSVIVRKLILIANKLLLPGHIYDHYFRQYKPDTLLIGSIGYGIDDLMINSAKRNKCSVISLPFSWDNSSTRGYRGGSPDLVITWTERMAKEIEIFHDIPSTSIKVGGVAHWDSYFNGQYQAPTRSTFMSNKGLDPNKKLLFYSLSAPRHLKHRFEIITMILDSITMNKIKIPSQLLVRFHPSDLFEKPDGTLVIQDYDGQIKNIKQQYKDIVKFWVPDIPHKNSNGELSMDDMFRMADAITHCDIIIQEYSTLIMETSIFDKPVINISMHTWEQNLPLTSTIGARTHLRHILSFNSCTTVESTEEFITATNQYLEDPLHRQQYRSNLLESELNTNRGTAGNAIGNMIANHIEYKIGAV